MAQGNGLWIAMAVAVGFAANITGCSAAADEQVKCQGINECSGQSECASEGGNSCEGQNECKGQGWVTTTRGECEDQGGVELAAAEQGQDPEIEG